MALGIVSPEVFESELEKSSDISGAIKHIERGRGVGNIEVPDELRKIIGGTSVEEGRKEALEIARHFGVSDASVSAYANGASSLATYNQGSGDLANYLSKVRNRVTKKASRKLLGALDSMTDDKLEALKPTDAALVARAMTGVIKDLIPENPNQDKSAPVFNIYAPSVHKNETYLDVIRVEE